MIDDHATESAPAGTGRLPLTRRKVVAGSALSLLATSAILAPLLAQEETEDDVGEGEGNGSDSRNEDRAAGGEDEPGERAARVPELLLLLTPLERTVVNLAERGLDLFDAAAFAADDQPAPLRDGLVTMLEQDRAHLALLEQVLAERRAAADPSLGNVSDPRSIAEYLERLTSLKAASVIGYATASWLLNDRDLLRSTLGLQSVEARHAAFLATLLNQPPFPDAIDPVASRQRFDKILEENGLSGLAASTPAPASDSGAIAEPQFDDLLADAASQLDVEIGDLELATVEERDWPDSALGCTASGEVAADVITPGYRVIVTDGERELEYRTDLDGQFRQC